MALGATLAGNISFRDRYFDTPNWRLTLADHWLREREGAGWELKCPPQPLEGTTESWDPQGLTQVPAKPLPLQPLEGAGRPDPATQYQEVTCPRDIVVRVCGLLGVDLAVSWGDDVARAVEELGLEEFASFVTRRRKYRVRELCVDLDEADFGYAVGEVEAVVRQQEDVPEALERIQELGRQLGESHRGGLRDHGSLLFFTPCTVSTHQGPGDFLRF